MFRGKHKHQNRVVNAARPQGRRANKKAVKDEYNRLSDPGYAAKMRTKEKEQVRFWRGRVVFCSTPVLFSWKRLCARGVGFSVVLSRGELRGVFV